ncbi:hypothetical protein PENTCL1PPCAC_28989, partial [Pristionchus entomophagus]
SAAAQGIKCVQCSTLTNPDCEDNEDRHVQVCPKLHSGKLEGAEAVGCRKILQKIGDEKSTIRECAYIEGDVDGQRKTGNSGIILYYYQCSNGPDASGLPCNSVSGFSLVASSLVALVARIFI